MSARTAALLRERAELQRQLARVDSALADEAAEAENDTTRAALPTEVDRQRARRDVDRVLQRRGR